MKKALLILLFAPIPVFADEAQIGCDLAQAQAEVSASELRAPSAFVSGGDQIGQKTLAVGLSQSVSGFVRAGKIHSAADAQCEALQASTKLDQYTLWSTSDIQKKGAVASIKVLNNAISLAEENLKYLNTLFAENVVAIADIHAAETQLELLQKSKYAMLTIMATVIPPVAYDDISSLISEYQADQGKAAELTAQSVAHQGWDFVVAIGENKPIGSQPVGTSTNAAPFVTARIQYSFGTHAAMKAAEEVGKNTSLLLQNQQAGYTQTFARHRKEIQSLIDIETQSIASSTKEIASFQRIRLPLENVDSQLAIAARQTLDIEIKADQADLAGASVRLNELKILFGKMN